MENPAISGLIEKLKVPKNARVAPSLEDALINVNKITERAGTLYEKLRYLVDYKEDPHIRRSAIERIIKRKILLERADGIGLSLVQELISGGYLPNNSIADSVIREIEAIVHKYKLLEHFFPLSFKQEPSTRKILVSLLSTEIENFFYPNEEDNYVADAFYLTMFDYVRVNSGISDEANKVQILVACYRALLNTDDETLLYKLWLKSNPLWLNPLNEVEIEVIAKKSPMIISGIREALIIPLSFRIIPKLSNYAIYFGLIHEIVRAYGAESDRIFRDEILRSQFVENFLKTNYKRQYDRARGAAMRAIVYIFLTKVLLALSLEVTYQIFILNTAEYIPIATNIIFHPLLLLFMTFSVRPIGKKNTDLIIEGVQKIITGEGIRMIQVSTKNTGFFNTAFYTLYFMMFLIIFGGIVAVLQKVNFSSVSILLFICFIALVSYFALRIRHSANKWKVRGDDRTASMVFNLFTLPIIRAGKWLSRKFSSINLFAFVLDFIIETPFKLLLHFSDSFMFFLREKQDDVY